MHTNSIVIALIPCLILVFCVLILIRAKRAQAIENDSLAEFAQRHGLIHERRPPQEFVKAWETFGGIAPATSHLAINALVYGTLNPDETEISVFSATTALILPGGAIPYFRTVLSTPFHYHGTISIRRKTLLGHLEPKRLFDTGDAEFDQKWLILADDHAAARDLLNSPARHTIRITDQWWEQHRSLSTPGHPAWIIASGRLVLVLPSRPRRICLDEAILHLLTLHDALLESGAH